MLVNLCGLRSGFSGERFKSQKIPKKTDKVIISTSHSCLSISEVQQETIKI